ncbi:hypothetical protein [Paracoccus aeridis]|uniref:hypothetical protein n=1 Tax=Paracoccus aeridis TaxID=1966466 RepID=UPI0010A9A840|nr:hypothetical protein [Paracoccus aeridis]
MQILSDDRLPRSKGDVLGLHASHKAALAGQEPLHNGTLQADVFVDHSEELAVTRRLRKADGEALDLKSGGDDAFWLAPAAPPDRQVR